MKRYFLFFVIAAITVFSSCDVRRKDKIADDNSRLMNQALKDSTLVELIDTTYNFGSIKQGEKVTYNFKFKNIGKKPLVVTNATASCGCTIPEKPEKPVMPGETSFIKVVFNSAGKLNHQEKIITVSANTDPANFQVKLFGEVTPAKQ